MRERIGEHEGAVELKVHFRGPVWWLEKVVCPTMDTISKNRYLKSSILRATLITRVWTKVADHTQIVIAIPCTQHG